MSKTIEESMNESSFPFGDFAETFPHRLIRATGSTMSAAVIMVCNRKLNQFYIRFCDIRDSETAYTFVVNPENSKEETVLSPEAADDIFAYAKNNLYEDPNFEEQEELDCSQCETQKEFEQLLLAFYGEVIKGLKIEKWN